MWTYHGMLYKHKNNRTYFTDGEHTGGATRCTVGTLVFLYLEVTVITLESLMVALLEEGC